MTQAELNTGRRKYNSNLIPSSSVWTPPGLSEESNRLISLSLADNTWQKYNKYLLIYLNYCQSRGLHPLNTSEVELANFVAHNFNNESLSSSSINHFKAALNKYRAFHGIKGDPFNHGLVTSVLKGISNAHTRSSPPTHRRTRLAASFELVKITGHFIETKLSWSPSDRATFWSAVLVSWWGSIRLGDMLSITANSISQKALSWKDISSLDENTLSIRINLPKCPTPNEKGETYFLCKYKEERYCPVFWINQIKPAIASPETPVFVFSSGKCITQGLFNKIMHEVSSFVGLPTNIGFSGHSLRAGLPTYMAAHPHLFSHEEIKRHGKWRSNAVERYTRAKADESAAIVAKFKE